MQLLAFFKDPAFWLYFSAWLPFFLFALIYGIGSPWYESRIGRALFLTAASIVLVLTNGLIVIILGDYAWRETVRGVLLGLVVVAAWYLLFAMIRIQRKWRRGTVPPRVPQRRITDHHQSQD